MATDGEDEGCETPVEEIGGHRHDLPPDSRPTLSRRTPIRADISFSRFTQRNPYFRTTCSTIVDPRHNPESDFGRIHIHIVLDMAGIEDLGWAEPTPIQEKIISFCGEGRDIVARACTGSGKTGAFLLPIIQSTLSTVCHPNRAKETSHQTHKFLKKMCKYAEKVTSVNLSDDTSVEFQEYVHVSYLRSLLTNYKPNIIISTYKPLLHHLHSQKIQINPSFRIWAIDEADLCLALPHRRRKIIEVKNTYFRDPHQVILTSATVGRKSYRHFLLKNAVILNLNRSHLPPPSQLSQYVLSCGNKEK
ncbi:probable ATP-dependent RNA helicase DDX56 [Octopus sinensis]|uniref:ATP-dependent RNA helicase n=1 Tax=Octopus sinensis TaxID=2607531 RepID=A0A6P7TYS0_9MOLL|nr:probable ATP-dependent RNA helicase DDX56 [Octopus sinensis]